MKVVTTCHKEGWNLYGQRCFAGLKHWPKQAEFVWYTEGFDRDSCYPVTFKRNEDLDRLQEFKAKWRHYVSPSWRYDVCRFANKAYAVYDALYDHDGLGVWMDADVIAHADIPEGYVESLLPEGDYIAMFKREGWHSECGFWVVNCAHPEHKRVFDTFLGWYEFGRFREAHEWHDSVLFDAAIRTCERAHLISSHNLSGKWSNQEHPMAKHDISQYVDHLKGLERKLAGASPERMAA